jgi:hypothetical protein
MVAAFQRPDPTAAPHDDPFLNTMTGFGQQTHGALTLEPCVSFPPAQQLDLQSRNSIAADGLLAGNAEITEAPVRRLRANDPRLTLSLDSGGRSIPIDLQN